MGIQRCTARLGTLELPSTPQIKLAFHRGAMDELIKHVSTSAFHDTSTRQGDQTTDCHPKTRRRLLGELADVLGSTQNRVNWLYGPAGAGKTSIMRSLASLFKQRGQFIGGFHFWRSDSGRNTLKHFVATLAYQLAQNEPATLPLITQALTQDILLPDKSTKTQMEKLIIEPLLACSAGPPSGPRCILIDGLDECDEEGQREFLETLLPTLVSRLSPGGITFLIASRPERAIDALFTHPRLSSSINRIFLEPSPEDVREFIVAEFEEINRRHPKLKKKYGGQWPKNEQLDRLVEKSSGYFILCATAMRHINPPILHGRPPDQRLDEILEAVSADTLRPLDALYLFILRQHAPKLPGLLDEWKRSIGLICMPLDLSNRHSPWLVLGEANAPVPVIELWHGKDIYSLKDLLAGLESLVYFDEETGQPKVYHASFPDFIFNQSRSQEFYMDPAHLHRELACLLVKTLSLETLPNYPLLWTDSFSYHMEHASMADDMVAKAIDDINWPNLSERLDLSDFRICGVFSGLNFLATIFLELQRFYDHFDVPSALQRRQSMVAGLTPVVKMALDAATGPKVFDKPENLRGAPAGDIMVHMWQHLMEQSGTKNPNLLYTHSTLCLQRQKFPTTPRGRWHFTCIGSGCLRHDSDDEQLFAQLLEKDRITYYSTIAYRIWRLLTALDLPMQHMMSHFFDQRFPDRCGAILLASLNLFRWETPKDTLVKTPEFSSYNVSILSQYIGHSAPAQSLLDRVWEIFFLHDGGQFFDQLKYYVEGQHTQAEAENPVSARATRRTLAFFNRCLQSGLCPDIGMEIPTLTEDEDGGEVLVDIPVPLSESEQKDIWSKYSTLVTYVPPYLPDDSQAAASAESRPSFDDAVVSDDQSSSPQGPQESAGPSSATQSAHQAVSESPQTEPSSGTKRRRKRSFWKRLL